VNAQSGKGGVSFLLQQQAGLHLPRKLQIEFSGVVQKVSDTTGKEVKSADIVKIFEQEYFGVNSPFSYQSSKLKNYDDSQHQVDIIIYAQHENKTVEISGTGNGPIDAAAHALSQYADVQISVVDYSEHSVGEGSDVAAVCYVEMKVGNSKSVFGVGKDSNIIAAAIKALINGVNRNQKTD